LDWESDVADTRIHGTTRQQISKVFNEVERARLLPLPAGLFPVFEEAPRTVHRDGYVELQRAYYSVPPEYVGRQVWARWKSRLLRVFNQRREVIAVHVLAEPGKFTTDPSADNLGFVPNFRHFRFQSIQQGKPRGDACGIGSHGLSVSWHPPANAGCFWLNVSRWRHG
jgi:hypothetical protein